MSGLLNIGSMLGMGDFLGGGGKSTLLGLIGTAFSARDQYLKEEQVRQDQIAMGHGLTGLAGAMGNETMPMTQNVGPLGDITLPYNPVQDLLNYQKDIGGKLLDQHTGSENRLQDFIGQQLSGYDSDSKTILGDYNASLAPVQQALQQRYDRGMANLQGMGDQARKDINRSYDSSMGSQTAALASRGLGNSTLLANAMTGNERNRQSTLGNLEESLRAQRLSTDAGLSGDVINNQRATAMGANALLQSLTSGRQSLAGGLGASLLDLQQSNVGNRVSFDSAVGQQRQNLGNSANTNIMNILSGVSMPYPGSENMNAIQDYWGGAGAYQGLKQALNMQEEEQDKQRVVAGLTFGLGGPAAAFGGSFLGQTGSNLANSAFKSGGGGGSSMAGYYASGNGPYSYQG